MTVRKGVAIGYAHHRPEKSPGPSCQPGAAELFLLLSWETRGPGKGNQASGYLFAQRINRTGVGSTWLQSHPVGSQDRARQRQSQVYRTQTCHLHGLKKRLSFFGHFPPIPHLSTCAIRLVYFESPRQWAKVKWASRGSRGQGVGAGKSC